jgi:anti-sigma regulatory factor (Ser/Thr protein kinase)
VTLGAFAGEAPSAGPFRHEAFFYAGEGQFLEGTSAFVRGALDADEPVLVVVSARKIDLLRGQLGADAREVRFADMDDVGLNPARIIPAWTDFVAEHAGRPVSGIGEPIWAARSPAELVECQRHESLLNVAFVESAGFSLMCPYDVESLSPEVVAEARHSHPFLKGDGSEWMSPAYPGPDELAKPFSTPLPDPPGSSVATTYQAGSLRAVRALARREATQAGFGEAQVADVVSAVNELASNSLRHAGGWGEIRVWRTEDALICEIADDGSIDDPLAGRVRPELDASSGRGLWMVNQLCELVQVRATPTGTTVRVHFRSPSSS